MAITTTKTHTSDVRLVRDAGGTYTPEYDKLIARRERFDTLTTPQEQLVTAIINDADDDTVALWKALAVAAADTTPVQEATVRKAVERATDPLIRAELAKTATANYEHIRSQFNAAADAFTKAHHVVSAATDPGLLALAPEKTRKAWAEGQAVAVTLNNLIPVLLAAARLTGLKVTNEHALGFTINADGLHRRRVWEAWESDTRWTALLELGAKIHAPRLDDYQEYPKPRPVEQKPVSAFNGALHVVRLETHDPEDIAVG